MEFVHQPYQPGETIAALATPPGEGGIAIIRLSGNGAIAVADRIFSGDVASYQSHTAHLGYVKEPKGERIDQALCLVMRGPRSFSGEDTVELQCHGGMIAARRVLEAALAAGARGARPGEFTFKAFMNGKIDLSQAEAIQQLIGAKSEAALSQASEQLAGTLSRKIGAFQSRATHLAAILEAWVDFPEEGIAFASLEELKGDLEGLRHEILSLKETFDDGQKLHHGIALCIAGRPNVGKSSLMNALLGKERAIVTPIAGTTRDLLEEDLCFGGLSFRLIDTAGLRETTEVIEKEGIKRTLARIAEADLLLLLLDATQKLNDEEQDLLSKCASRRSLVVWNKLDLPGASAPPLPHPHVVRISAKEGLGLEELKKTIGGLVWTQGVPSKEELVISSERHREALERAACFIEKVTLGLDQELSPEFLSTDMRQALFELGTILGSNITDDILTSIFSTFCIGK